MVQFPSTQNQNRRPITNNQQLPTAGSVWNTVFRHKKNCSKTAPKTAPKLLQNCSLRRKSVETTSSVENNVEKPVSHRENCFFAPKTVSHHPKSSFASPKKQFRITQKRSFALPETQFSEGVDDSLPKRLRMSSRFHACAHACHTNKQAKQTVFKQNLS